MNAIGTDRVMSPPGALPQAAERLSTAEPLAGSDIEIEVGLLNLDSASYRDLVEHHAGNPANIRAEVLDIVATRGKMSNPRTGSGGMLVGKVNAIADTAECP
ncbi:hypothetical protein [Mycolicibacterium sp. CBMA 295]|uniref:hypothetical protein n=1 Tax=Mycolicibacterium sp. CBMA 295 TaxID=2606605 RepID=UPI00192E3662|nr:hypothetical protein [Mycolicibacterium sp. CBMA 295]